MGTSAEGSATERNVCPLVKPSLYPEIRGVEFISLRRLFRDHLDMQFEDVRTMLRLPKAAVGDAGCNFATAGVILNLISGISVCVYQARASVPAKGKSKAKPSSIEERGTSGRRFKGVLRNYFPWDRDTIGKNSGPELLYDLGRNPLAHALGLAVPGAPNVAVLKGPLSQRKIQELENRVRPRWVDPPLCAVAGGYHLDVAGMYWGTHRMLHNVLADRKHALGAESLARELGF